MNIATQADTLRFPAFFNDARYDAQAVSAICDLLINASSHDCKPTAPLFKAKFDVIESSGATRKLEVAIFASASKSGNPYLSCSIKPVQDFPAKSKPPVVQGDQDFDDDIPF